MESFVTQETSYEDQLRNELRREKAWLIGDIALTGVSTAVGAYALAKGEIGGAAFMGVAAAGAVKSALDSIGMVIDSAKRLGRHQPLAVAEMEQDHSDLDWE